MTRSRNSKLLEASPPANSRQPSPPETGTRARQQGGRSSSLVSVKKSLRFLDVLSSRNEHTVAELLQALGETRPEEHRAQRSQQRAAQRQLDVLVQLGLAKVVEASPGLPTTYCLSDKATLRGLTRHVTIQEWAVLQMAASQLRSLLPMELQDALRDALQRLAPGTHGSDEYERARAWSRKTGFVPTTLDLRPPRMPSGVMKACFEALWNDRPLQLDYVDSEGRPSNPEVQPLALVQQGSSHVLVAKRLADEKIRHYVLHRMQSARVCSKLSLPYPEDFNLERDALQGKFGFGDGSTVKVCFEIEKQSGGYLEETPLSADQQVVTKEDGWLEITATVPDNLWFWDWLRSFGTRARLIEPTDRVRNLRRYPKGHPSR